jgi:hypothetical protein
VGHEDGGSSPTAQDLAQLVAEGAAQRRVERRERLVEEQQGRVDRERPAERHPLALASGELVGQAWLQAVEAEAFDNLGHTSCALGPRPVAQAEADVLGNRQVGKQRVALEDVADMPLLGWKVHARSGVEEDAVIHDDASGIGPDQAREALQGERLAGARGAEEDRDPVARGPRDVQRETGQALRDLDGESVAHAALAPRRPARTSTRHESTVSASTSTTASPISPVCTAV